MKNESWEARFEVLACKSNESDVSVRREEGSFGGMVWDGNANSPVYKGQKTMNDTIP